MKNLLVCLVIVLVQSWGSHAAILDPFDEFHNSSGLHKIMSGINDLAASVGKIGAKLFNSSKPEVIVKEYHEVWEATTWTSLDEHEIKYHGASGRSNRTRVRDHEVRYHGRPRSSDTLSQHEAQYHGSDSAHRTRNLKEHETKYHNNPDAPCEDLNQHEVKHHGRSANVHEHETKYHIIAEHEREHHGVQGGYSANMEQHIQRFHTREDLKQDQQERVRFHEEQLHGKPRCPYKRACNYVTENAHWFMLGSAALFTLFLL